MQNHAWSCTLLDGVPSKGFSVRHDTKDKVVDLWKGCVVRLGLFYDSKRLSKVIVE